MFKKILALMIVIAGLAGAGILTMMYRLSTPYELREKEKKYFLISHGENLIATLSRLHEAGFLPAYAEASLYVRVRSKLRPFSIKAGEYDFSGNLSALDVLRILEGSRVVLHKVVIPEGFNMYQVVATLVEAKLGNEKRFRELLEDPDFIKETKSFGNTLEGYLFPDTYAFSRLDSEKTIFMTMVERFHKEFKEELVSKGKTLGLSPYEIITLASIIEKETGVAEERMLISSVFHNRLKKGMRLQSDPTTIYGIAGFNGNLTKANLLTPSPYNTYTLPKLPVGPIANPGKEALWAAVQPADTNYLYFVSRNDGTHIFSKTYEEHAKNVRIFQQLRRGN